MRNPIAAALALLLALPLSGRAAECGPDALGGWSSLTEKTLGALKPRLEGPPPPAAPATPIPVKPAPTEGLPAE